jgi:hypothetical protein
MTAYCFHDAQMDEALDEWCQNNPLLSHPLGISQEAAKNLIRAFLASPQMAKARMADKATNSTPQPIGGST